MQRYFIIENDINDDQTVTISNEDAHHIINVMHMQSGDEVILSFPSDESFIAMISEIQDGSVTFEMKEKMMEEKALPVSVTIAQGLPKGSKLELIVQKGTELGADKFEIIQMDRSVAKWDQKATNKKLPRYEKIIKEASEQSHRTSIPKIDGIRTLDAMLQDASIYDHILFAYEEEAKTEEYHSFYVALKHIKKADRVLLFIGPEGGFSKREVEQLKSYGAHAVRLGKRILRTETASLYALSALSFYFEELEAQ